MGLLVEEPLFPQLDIRGVGAAPPTGRAPMGRTGAPWNTHLEQALALDWPGIERVGSVWAHGNDSRLTAPDERRVRTAIAEAAAETGREGAVREAFLGGQAAIFRACKPVVGALEHWWNSYPEVPAMESAGYAAAALVVADRLEGEALDLALRPWRVLADGHPAGYFGSRTPQVDALLDAIPLLTLEQCDRVVATWARPRLPALQRWRAGAHLAPGEWWPADGPRPRLEKTLLETIGPDMRAERHLDEALASSWMRGGVRKIGGCTPSTGHGRTRRSKQRSQQRSRATCSDRQPAPNSARLGKPATRTSHPNGSRSSSELLEAACQRTGLRPIGLRRSSAKNTPDA